MTRIRLALALAAATALIAPAAAPAATIGYEGTTLVYRAAPGEQNRVIVDGFGGDAEVSLSDSGVPRTFPADKCSTVGDDYGVTCVLLGDVRVELGDGDDEGSFGLLAPGAPRYVLDGGPGADTLKGMRADVGAATLAGGDGDDVLTSFERGETLDGGAGDDALEGAAGDDVLHGGAGDDRLMADGSSEGFRFFSDVIDGGPGTDSLTDYHSGDPALAPPITITLDGIADDGREGERDDIRAVESFDVSSVGRFVGDDAANAFYAPEVGRGGFLDGRGGDDTLVAGDAADEVLGGSGADAISGGMGDDRLVGGPGPDVISGDRPARCNEYHCDVAGGYGDDTIDARDGERDMIACGEGTDTVLADAVDVLAEDCETTPGGGGAGPGTGPDGQPAGGACSARKVRGLRLKVARKRLEARGCTVKVKRVRASRKQRGRVLRVKVSGERAKVFVGR
ncbi:MAG TPA: calcium-binding protein [Solirubrobacteraceae bacterium]|nr:calcium-binding protein [Solirubrobacteraceae bacterium]